jgi:hypothetical protein
MKRLSLLIAVAVLCAGPAARAGGVNFNWGTTCYSEAPLYGLTFACNSNTSPAAWTMTASFMVDTEMADFVGVEISLEGQSASPLLPDWWKLGATDCRAHAMTFHSDASGVATETCMDWANGRAFDLFGYTWDPNRAHVAAAASIETSTPYDLQPGVEYYAGTFTLLNRRTVGEGACAGCAYGFIWGIDRIIAVGLDGRRDVLDSPMPYGNDCLHWNDQVMCCRCALPVKRTAWGELKSLYR